MVCGSIPERSMTNEKYEGLIAKLAKMFAVKSVDTKILYDALQLLCMEFSFEYGAIYEVDRYNQMILKERYTEMDIPFRESIPVEEIGRQCMIELNRDIVSYVLKGENNSEYEARLLELFSAESVAMSSEVDGELNIDGFIILFNVRNKPVLSLEEIELLSVLFTMFGRYASGRVHESQIEAVKNSLESILDNTGIDIYVNDFYTHDILYVNKSMAAPYGGVSEFEGNKCWQVLFPEQGGPCEFCPQKNIVDEEGNPTKVYTWDYQRAFDGSWFRVFSAAFRWIDGRLAHVVSSADITDNKHNEELIQYMANYDSLTNLPNRRMLITECERRINQAEEENKGYVLFFDIDGFKEINDNYGHDAGDEFLIKLGEFFSGIPLLKESIYRNGGDEFVAIIHKNISEENVRSLIEFIHMRFRKAWELKKGSVYCGTSVGVACYPEDGTTAEELLYKADQAMYKVKKAGGGGQCFVKDMLQRDC